MTDTPKQNGGNTGKVILIVVFIVALVGINVFQFLKGKKDTEQFQETIEMKDSEIATQVQ